VYRVRDAGSHPDAGGGAAQVLCKPKIMPLKSITLERLEEMEKAAAAVIQQQTESNQQFR
jgi:hypothetical protein